MPRKSVGEIAFNTGIVLFWMAVLLQSKIFVTILTILAIVLCALIFAFLIYVCRDEEKTKRQTEIEKKDEEIERSIRSGKPSPLSDRHTQANKPRLNPLRQEYLRLRAHVAAQEQQRLHTTFEDRCEVCGKYSSRLRTCDHCGRKVCGDCEISNWQYCRATDCDW